MKPMKCPRCNTPLMCEKIENFSPGSTIAGIDVDVCYTCQGIWFDKGELDRVENVIEPTFIEFRRLPNQMTQYLPLKCPNCRERDLVKIQNKRDKKVIMDVCPDCKGVWLDGGELKAVRQESLLSLLCKAVKFAFMD